MLASKRRVSALFHNFALAHDDDAIGHVRDDGQVMGDHQQPHVKSRARSRNRSRICAWVVTSSALSVHPRSAAGAQRDGHRNHHPLALPAGQFMRIARQREAVWRQATRVSISAARARRLCVRCGRGSDRFRPLDPRWFARVQRGHRFLKHHADVVAAHATHIGLGRAAKSCAIQQDRPTWSRRRAAVCITASAVIDLPEPLSPVTATISPR